MTTAIQKLLESFDFLSDAEKQHVAAEMIRHVVQLDFSPLSDEDLVSSVEKLFLELDRQEIKHE